MELAEHVSKTRSAALNGGSPRVLPVGLAGAFSAALLAFAITGLYTRYAADDYCTAGQLVANGLLGAQSDLYVAWSGRFTATLLITMFESLGTGVLPLLAAGALVLWVIALAWAIRELTRLRVTHAIALAALLVYATLDMTADRAQDLYWQTGLLTYLSPLIFATLEIGLFARFAKSGAGAWNYCLCFVIAFIAGGTSETFAFAHLAALGVALAGTLLAPSNRLRGLLAASCAGAVVALALIAVAPGNEVREISASRTPLPVAVPLALQFTEGWLRLSFARPHAVTLALLLGVPTVLAITTNWQTRIRRIVVPVIAGAAVVIFACMLPAYYALGTNPPGRAQLIAQFVLVGTVLLISYALAPTVARLWLGALRGPAGIILASISMLVLIATGPLLNIVQSVRDVDSARAYATEWDQIDASIRAERSSGTLAVRVPHLAPTGMLNLDFVGSDQSDWLNQCVARYYGVTSIATGS
jgi:uncharacterized protein DUF6056